MLAHPHPARQLRGRDGAIVGTLQPLRRGVQGPCFGIVLPDVFRCHEVAGAHQGDGRMKKAIELLERMVAVSETTLAEAHPDRWASQRNRATIYYANGEQRWR